MKTKGQFETELLLNLKAAQKLCDDCDREDRDFTDDERSKVAAYLAEARRVKTEISNLEGEDPGQKKAKQDEEMRDFILNLGKGLEAAVEGKMVVPGPRHSFKPAVGLKSCSHHLEVWGCRHYLRPSLPRGKCSRRSCRS